MTVKDVRRTVDGFLTHGRWDRDREKWQKRNRRKVEPHRETALRLHREGKTYQEIADVLGCSRWTVFRWFRHYRHDSDGTQAE